MGFRPDYVIRETAHNFTRNVTLTVATVMAMAIALTLMGSGLFMKQGVSNATQRWEGDVELIVYMRPDAQPAQIDSVRGDLDENPQVESYRYLDHTAAYDEFLDLFEDQPDFTDAVEPQHLPTSFKVVPGNPEAEVVSSLQREFQQKPGVFEVAAATEDIRKMEETFGRLSNGTIAIAIVLATSALLLIFNSIRMAIYARRREIEVMKLVGATNWFIRVPYMLEGLLQGVLGWVLSMGLLSLFLWAWSRLISNRETLEFFSNFRVREIWPTFVGLGLVGCLVGMIGSGIAATRFLKV
jgi:cell division transport system permease protein